jgi:DMSO/TMAO reductase YedYZ molybdopterin-dependent catalytic subunit
MGVSLDHKLSKYVEFKGQEGYCGCIPFRKANDPYGDVLIAWEMNGEPLTPDHGQPLRIIVPGYSGKCSTKWLTGISVRDIDSDFGKHKQYYKLFPSSLKPGTLEYDKYKASPEYTIGELNVNSVIFEPHSQTICQSTGPLKVSGYAHTGGGRPLSRIEVSGNGGKTWEQVRPLKQQLTDAGQLWAWVRYEHTLEFFDPSAEDAEIVVRAWDAAANTQPEWPIWNYTGMLNNHLYRVKVLKHEGKQLFVHPAQWMDPHFKLQAVDLKCESVQHSSDHVEALKGAWKIGEFVDSTVHLCVAPCGEEVTSVEARWSKQPLHAKVCRGADGELEIAAHFGGLEVLGTVFQQQGQRVVRWRNGMVWAKL